MKMPKASKLVAPALATLLIGGVSAALAHGGGQGMAPGEHPSYMRGGGYGYHEGMMAHGPGYGRGMMGPGMGHGYGPGYAPGFGMTGPGMGRYRDTDLTTTQVKEIMAHRLSHYGNPRLRVGNVEEQDEDIIVAEIETVDGSLVDRFHIDRHTGQMSRAE